MLETVTCARKDIFTMEEPQAFASAVADVLARYPSGHIYDTLTAASTSHRRNLKRRAEVLKHEDLRERLQRELGYQRADQWNGYVPPATVNEFSVVELCQSRRVDRTGQVIVRFNQRGRYAVGEMENDSDRRKILVEISQEAWRRASGERQPPTPRQPTPPQQPPPQSATATAPAPEHANAAHDQEPPASAT